MEVINDSLKNVAKAIELLKSLVEVNCRQKEETINEALKLLEKTLENLSNSVE